MLNRTLHRHRTTLSALALMFVGVVLLTLPIGTPWVHFSYDIMQWVQPQQTDPDTVMVLMDQQAFQDYGLSPKDPWPRSVHARLLDRLKADGPKVVVFDVTWTQADTAEGDAALAQAIRENGKVVLAADRIPVPGIETGYTIVPPLAVFETNAAAYGTAKVVLDADRVARRYDPGNDQVPSLDWSAARVAGARVTQDPARRTVEQRWLNYYASPRPFALASMTYSNAESRPPGFFKNKAVFIGGQPETLLRGETTDLFGTPFTRWGAPFILGVEVAAIAYSNLLHEEWLHRLSPAAECAWILFLGALLGMAIQRLSPRGGLWLGLGLLLGIGLAIAIVGQKGSHVWFPWAIVILGQWPLGMGLRWLISEPAGANEIPQVVVRANRDAVSQLPKDHPAASAGSGVQLGNINIPDHRLLRCIGEGAYGQVWIAENAVGIFHAVKVVYRDRFAEPVPYERAFRGIQRFMPISRTHEGFVNILHVGRNDTSGVFFYIMELGDDAERVAGWDPASYAPKTLNSELKKRGALPARECLELLLSLSAAVQALHQNQLIHRDIKPANLIFVQGRVKLADIDLVTELTESGGVSRIGTEGYMAPEGPGTAAADVFSLGRILYVALTAKLPHQLPELPTRAGLDPDAGLLLELHQIACRASDLDLSRRYATAEALRSELLALQRKWKPASRGGSGS